MLELEVEKKKNALVLIEKEKSELEERLKNLNFEKKKLETDLLENQTELSEIKYFVGNASLFLPVLVDKDFEIKNGVVGMKRDTVMKIIKIIMCHNYPLLLCSARIKSLVGMLYESYTWSKQRSFKQAMHPLKPIEYISGTGSEYKLRGDSLLDVDFGKDSSTTVFLKNPCRCGVMKFCFTILYTNERNTFSVGVADEAWVPNVSMCISNKPGILSYNFTSEYMSLHYDEKSTIIYDTSDLHNVPLCAEVNMTDRIFHLSARGKRFPYFNIRPAAVVLGLSSSYHAHRLCFISYQRTSYPSEGSFRGLGKGGAVNGA